MKYFHNSKQRITFLLLTVFSLNILLSGCYTLKNSKKLGTEDIPGTKEKTTVKKYSFETKQYPSIENPVTILEIQEDEQYRIKTQTKYENKYVDNLGISDGLAATFIIFGGLVGSAYFSYLFQEHGSGFEVVDLLLPVCIVPSWVGIAAIATKPFKIKYEYKPADYKYYYETYPLPNANISIVPFNKSQTFKTENNGLLQFNLVSDFEITYAKNNNPINIYLKYNDIDFTNTLELEPSSLLYKYAKILKPTVSIWEHSNHYSKTIGNARKGLEYRVLEENVQFNRYKVELFTNKVGWLDFRDVETYYSIKSKTDISIAIKNYVEEKMTEWQKQGEFESPDDYFNRMGTREGKLKELTYEAMGSYQNDYINMISWNEAQISRYDPNSQTFKIEIPEINEFVLQVPIEIAQIFKENWGKKKFDNQKFILVDGNWELSFLEIEVPEVNRTIEYNSDLIYSYNPVNQFSFELEPIKINLTTNNEFDDLATIKYDISINLPKTNMSNPEAIAVVIGNTTYKYTSNVDYAINDAQLVKTYLINVLGYKPGNVLFYKNASKADFEGLFGTKDNYKGKLYNFLKAGISDVFIFYSGHGAPGLNDQKGYFVPVDCDPLYIELQAYNSDILYNNLASVSAKSVTVITDACFSGADIINNISSIIPIVQQPIFKIENGSLFSSSSTDEVSCWLKQQQHGLFTYFFLKAIHDYKNS
ncbi:MAG: caspase family protein, partial [Bacteroidales bacterium]|nr:caspase family protein [Bacteroidales bacterium]